MISLMDDTDGRMYHEDESSSENVDTMGPLPNRDVLRCLSYFI